MKKKIMKTIFGDIVKDYYKIGTEIVGDNFLNYNQL